MSTSGFLKLAAVAALLTALTTLGVHFIEFQADTFEERLQFASNPAYIAHKWMIIVHCLMVIVSMFGVATLLWNSNKGLAALGALFFSVFGVTEIARMFSVLVCLNPLREKYLAAADAAVRQVLQLQMESWVLAAGVMFLVFILAFSLGNLCFGLAMMNLKGEDRWLARGFLLWGALTLLAFANSFWEISAVDRVVEWCNKVFQPLMRLAIGWWLFRKSAEAALSQTRTA